MAVSFIYFDVGGVALLDFSKTNKWNDLLDGLGLKGEQRVKFENLFGEYETLVCEGTDLNEFVEAATLQLNIKFPHNYSMLADFVNRFEVNTTIHPIIKELKKKYKIGLLTNMYPGMLDLINEKKLLPDIQWDVVIDSSVEKLRKPQEEIYKLAEERANTKSTDILFIENSLANVEAAKTRGWQTLLYDPANPEESSRELSDYLYSA